MTATKSASSLCKELADLRMDDGLSSEERSRRGMVVIGEMLSLEDDDFTEQVLAAFLRVDAELYRFVSAAVDEHLERQTVKLPDGAERTGTIFAIPLFFFHEEGDAVPDRIPVDFLPPLPDRRRVPRLSGAVLQWSDLYAHPSRIRGLHALLAAQGAAYDQDALDEAVRQWRGAPEDAWGNEFALSKGRAVGQRFLVAYQLDGEAPWFTSAAQEQRWLERATERSKNVGGGDWILALLQPSALMNALYRSFKEHVRNIELDFRATLRELYEGSFDNIDVLIEPFGVQASSIALYLRYSAISRVTRKPICWATCAVAMRTARAAWQDLCERRHIELAQAGFSHVQTVPKVQALQLLPNQLEGRRIHLYFGPTVMFEEAPKEGLPFESAGDPSHSVAKWWKYEEETAPLDAKLMLAILAPELQVSAESIVVTTGFALSLTDRRWYSIAIFDVEFALREAGGAARWPPSEAALNTMLAFTGFMGARLWVRPEVVGGGP